MEDRKSNYVYLFAGVDVEYAQNSAPFDGTGILYEVSLLLNVNDIDVSVFPQLTQNNAE